MEHIIGKQSKKMKLERKEGNNGDETLGKWSYWSNDSIWCKQQHSHLFQNSDGLPNLKKGLNKHPLPKGSRNIILTLC